ncbi:MAG: hypothetical protein JXM72_06415 [Deltaproteobacteria bacterium]|nr:hypothetical protein [Deltaproteobacteria bacterium]
MNKLHILSALKDDSYTIFPDTLLKDMRIDVHLSASEPIFKQRAGNETEEGIAGSFQSRVHPLVEISYSLSKRIALEFTGHFSRHMSRTSLPAGNRDNLYDYTLMVGPSFHMGRLNETTSMYTQFGLGYKFIDTDSYTLPGDCPSTLGTGVCFGLKTSRADIRVGVNHFRSFTDDALYQYDYDTRLDPSLMFLSITYNFDS